MTLPRMSLWRWLALAVAVAAVLLSIVNASWIAPRPAGRLVLVAMHGLPQPFAAAGAGCSAAHVRAGGDNPYIENSLGGIFKAVRMGGAVALPVQRTADGQMVVFRDPTLDCRTDGHGPVGARTLAELKALDIGHGYSADGGNTFPFRGRGVGGMPMVEEVLREVPNGRIVFRFVGAGPGDADALLAAFGRAGRTIDDRYGFQGDAAALARIRAAAPSAWTLGADDGQACLADYRTIGWTGFVPASCRDTNVILPLDAQWTVWGWPNRFQKRMADAGSKVVLVAGRSGGALAGLDRPEQLGEVPRDFRGHVWIEDFHTLGRALGR